MNTETIAIINLIIYGTSAAFQWYQIVRHHGQRKEFGWKFVVLIGLVALVCTFFAGASIPLLTHRDNTFFSGFNVVLAIWSIGVAATILIYYLYRYVDTLPQYKATIAELRLSRARETELRKLNYGLQNEIADIVAVVSHEIRTPLSLIDGYVQLLRGGDIYGALTQEQLDGLAGAGRGLDRLMYVVNRALVVRQALQPEAFDVARLVRSILSDERIWSTTRRSRSDNNIILSYDESTPPIIVEADRAKMQVLMTELVVNAIKFSNVGSEIIIGTWVENDCFVFSVEDEGIGIDLDKYREIIFEAGTQIRSSHMTRQHEGTGYGLAVVKALVIGHGGIIEVESKLGIGSTFTVRIPL